MPNTRQCRTCLSEIIRCTPVNFTLEEVSIMHNKCTIGTALVLLGLNRNPGFGHHITTSPYHAQQPLAKSLSQPCKLPVPCVGQRCLKTQPPW